MPVIKVASSKSKIPIPTSKVPAKHIYIDLLKIMIEEYFELQKIKNIEKTKRLKIKKQTEVTLKKLKTLEKISLRLIEKDYALKEKVLQTIMEKLQQSENPESIQICLQALSYIFNTKSLLKEIETIYTKLENDEEIEI